MFDVHQEKLSNYTFLGLFSGAGGLDLGFSKAGFRHIQSIDILDYAVKTLKANRPDWDVLNCDIRNYTPSFNNVDVLLAGFPCQGFSLGGKRDVNDSRNTLYKEVIRIAKILNPRVIVMENVLNLRTMIHPITKKPISQQIADELSEIGYKTKFQFFRVSRYGVPQTRRRFIFFVYKEKSMDDYSFPYPGEETPIKDFILDLATDESIVLPNHNPQWGFKSHVHTETGESCADDSQILPVRFSRTASEGNPIRTFDAPFPAVDTATVWGWAKGNIKAIRENKNRTEESSLYVRNPNSSAPLWRVSASRLRSFTAREYARLQTFPDNWVFIGKNKREIQLQIGNAVPVIFAKRIALSVLEELEIADGTRKRNSEFSLQPSLFDVENYAYANPAEQELITVHHI